MCSSIRSLTTKETAQHVIREGIVTVLVTLLLETNDEILIRKVL